MYMFLFNTDQNIELTPFWSRFTTGATAATANTTRFAEVVAMPAITYGNTRGGFISACADIANRWRVPFAGPTITGIRINNIGTSACNIAKFGIYTNAANADTDTSNLLSNAVLSLSTFIINGNVSSIPSSTWSTYTYTSTNVGETMNANNGSLTILFPITMVNASVIRLGTISSIDTIINIRFNVSVTYDNGNTWELYDTYFASNGSSLNTETTQFINSNSTQIAKSNVYTLWKRKWRTAPTIDDANLPYYTFPYDITRDTIGLATVTSNLISVAFRNIDNDKACTRYLTKAGTMGTSLLNVTATDKPTPISFTITTDSNNYTADITYAFNSLQKTFGADATGISKAQITLTSKTNSIPGWFMNPDSGQFAFVDNQITGSNILFPVSIKKTVTNRFYIEWSSLSSANDFINAGSYAFASCISTTGGIPIGLPAYNDLWNDAFNNIRGTIFHFVGTISQSTLDFNAPWTNTYTCPPNILCVGTEYRLKGLSIGANGNPLNGWVGTGGGGGDYFVIPSIKSTNAFKNGTNSKAGQSIISIVIDTAEKSYINTISEFETHFLKVYENGIRLRNYTAQTGFGAFYASVTKPEDKPCCMGYALCGNFKVMATTITTANLDFVAPQNIPLSRKGHVGGNVNGRLMPNTPLSYCAMTTETMDNRGFTPSEIDTSIANMMNRWGIVKAFRYMRITNTAGTSGLFFSKLGLYSTKAAAKAETGSGAESSIQSITTARLGPNDGNRVLTTYLATTTAFTTLDTSLVVITVAPAGGYPTVIDLGNFHAPSYIRFGTMGTGGTTTHRLKLELSADNSTWVEHEMRFYDSSNVLRNTRDNQFIASTATDANKTGTYNCASGENGIFLIYNPAWDTEDNLGNDGLLLGVSSMNSNNTVSGSNVTVLANSSNAYILAPTVTMTANGTLPLVTDAFGAGKNAILTRWGAGSTGMFSTTT